MGIKLIKSEKLTRQNKIVGYFSGQRGEVQELNHFCYQTRANTKQRKECMAQDVDEWGAFPMVAKLTKL